MATFPGDSPLGIQGIEELDPAQAILEHSHARTMEIYAEVNRSKIGKVMLEIG